MNLVVYSRGAKVGVLDMADSEPFYGFTYDEAYLHSNTPLPLSLSLPLREERFDGAHALPYFEGLLPEGDVRAAVARQLGISERSPAKLLRALGKDCAGDVAVLEEDDPYQPPAEDEYAKLDEGLDRIARNPFGEISRLRAGNRLSLAGGQEKIALYHDSREPIRSGWYIPIEGSPSTHIVKPQVNDAYPLLVYNEYFCMKLAQLAGIDVAKVEVIAPGRPLLIVERFDRMETGERNGLGLGIYRRARQEDFCQALGYDSSRKYETDGGPGIARLCKLLLTHSAQFIDDRKALLRLALFNYLIGNCDAHAKNYSVLLGDAGAVRLAPAYDLLSTTVYDGTFGAELSKGMGMRIGQHANIDKVNRDDVAQLARDCGISEGSLVKLGRSLADEMSGRFAEAELLLREAAEGDVSDLVSRIKSGIEDRSSKIGF